MSTTIQIPNGVDDHGNPKFGEAKIRELSEITVGQRRMVQATFMTVSHLYTRLPREVLEEAAAKKGHEAIEAQKQISWMMATLKTSREDAEALLSQQDAAIVAFLDSWNLTIPLPTMDTVQNLSPDLY